MGGQRRYDKAGDINPMVPEKKQQKKLPVWALVLIDVLATCLALALFALLQFVLPRAQDLQRAEETASLRTTIATPSPAPKAEEALPAQTAAPSPSPTPEAKEALPAQTAAPSPSPTPEAEEEPADDWKFGELTTEQTVITETSYSSHDIYLSISSYAPGEGVIESPYTVADIYVRDVRCLQSYFAGAAFIPTGHGENILDMMAASGAILASNGDYYSMQLGSGVLRNGVLYRYPSADFDVFVLYEDGSVKIYPSKAIASHTEWDSIFEGAWQAWSFGPSLLDEDGVPYSDLRAKLFSVMANRNPRTGLGYFEPGHYCLVVVDGRSETAAGATIEELASIFESLGCAQAYNLDGGGSSVMAFHGEVITSQSIDRKLPDIILVAEYEGSFAQKEIQSLEG